MGYSVVSNPAICILDAPADDSTMRVRSRSVPASLQYVIPEWEPAFLRQATEFPFYRSLLKYFCNDFTKETYPQAPDRKMVPIGGVPILG